jgi:hypothetical protein
MSRECDILIEDSDPARELIDAELGETSPHHEEYGTFVDAVSPNLPFLPDSWEQRLCTTMRFPCDVVRILMQPVRIIVQA